MLYLIDSANLEQIKRVFEFYPVDGVTTNPTIVSKENTEFIPLLKSIRNIIGPDAMLHVQAVSKCSDEIVKEAEYLSKTIEGNLYIKIPVIPEGIKAIKILSHMGIKTTATAVFTSQQALMAARAGADFVAPYVNRIDNIGGDGVNTVAEIVQLYETYGLKTMVLAASFKNVQQVHDVSLCGAHSVTVGMDIMDALIHHPLTDWSVDKFVADWEKIYGKGILTYNAK